VIVGGEQREAKCLANALDVNEQQILDLAPGEQQPTKRIAGIQLWFGRCSASDIAK